MPGTLPSHMLKKEYSLRDGAITFVLIFTLIIGAAFLFSWILGR
jgi:hypothetical protein